MSRGPKIPIVLIIAGNDPSGGAGLCADIQAISALDCHPAPVVTALTVQDTQNAYRVESVDAELVKQQIHAVLNDVPVAAIKIGLLGNPAIGHAIAELLVNYPELPVVIDPVLVATGGATLAESGLLEVYLEHLARLATVLTPNAYEIEQLGQPETDRKSQAMSLLKRGCDFVLAKGGDDSTVKITNQLFGPDNLIQEFSWPRVAGNFHGSGCTLASAVTAHLARGEPVESAVKLAQEYTAQTIQRGWQPGKGQHIPNRIKKS